MVCTHRKNRIYIHHMQKSKGNSWKTKDERKRTNKTKHTHTRRANKQQLCLLFITVLKVLIKTNHHKNGEDVSGENETESNRVWSVEIERKMAKKRRKDREKGEKQQTEERNKMLVQ